MLFTQATPDDEAEVRRLLRENPMHGRMPVSFEREPDGLGGPELDGERRCIIVARDQASGPVIGLCERIVRRGFVVGEERMLPYLGALRIARSYRRRIAIIRGGFAALREVEQPDEWPLALTSIAEDNVPAQRLLTTGVDGLPTYRPMGRFASLIMRPRRARSTGIEAVRSGQFAELASFLESRLRERQFSTCWTVDGLLNLPGATFLAATDGAELVGCVSLWDQQAFRQTVIHDYPLSVRAVRPIVNLAGAPLGLPRLPRPGVALRQAFLSHLVTKDDDSGIALKLIAAGLDLAAGRGLDAAVVGLPADHPWKGPIERRYRTLEFRTTLYGVSWPGPDDPALPSADRPVFPEIGLL